MGENYYRQYNLNAMTVNIADVTTSETGVAQRTNGLHYLKYVSYNSGTLTGTADGTFDIYGSVDGNTWTDISVQITHDTLVDGEGVQSAAVDISGYQFYRLKFTKNNLTAGTIIIRTYASR